MIYVWMCSRSGSSVVGGLLYHHGLRFTGEKNKTPYRSFENKASYPALRNGYDPEIMDSDDFWKGPVGLFNNWCKFIDPIDHKHVYVRRTPDDVAASLVKYSSGRLTKRDIPLLTSNVKIAYEWMDTIRRFCGGVNVYPEHLWRRDYGNIRKVFDYCELDFNEDIADSFITFR